MFIKQIYTSCLAESSYYIESGKEAAIIDPLREAAPYLELAEKRGAKINYIFETHFHADFVSGHLDLSLQSGAPIIYGPTATADFTFHEAFDGEEFKLGDITLRLLHTPGHTPESSCLLLIDENGNDHSLFTGDTLFVGDVGRPDLAVKSNLSQKDLAAMLYDSLEQKIKPLADDVIIYPAHGAGSSCGKNIGKETYSTLGEQKRMNYAMQPMNKDTFIEAVTSGLSAPPKYFFENARINKSAYKTLDSILENSFKALSIETVIELQKKDVLIIDTRSTREFEQSHINGSIFIGLNGMFAIWAASLIDLNREIVILAADQQSALESIIRLARVGIENVHGYIDGGIDAWVKSGGETSQLNSLNADELEKIKSGSLVLDVRRPSEFSGGHLDSAKNFPLDHIENEISDLDSSLDYVIYCAGGYRSVIASSLLKRNGIHRITNIRGGYAAIEQAMLNKE
ncbi:MAG: MBL fold metallo-hydrolase [Calditrichaeota bacterium]|nr:MBL fold metallo-hydrolase [Calditrichota bacterium]